MTAAYDVIVLGLGAMGSATCYHLARRGHRVLGLDAYERNHTRGSSHGRSRIISEAYFSMPQYLPLVWRAYDLWRVLGEETGAELLTIVGGLGIGPDGSEYAENSKRIALQAALPVEELRSDDLVRRFPGFRIPEDYTAIYDPRAGFLDPEACVAAHLDRAAQLGASIRHRNPVCRWDADGDGVRVDAESGTYHADRLVVAAGPWAAPILHDLGLPLRVERKVCIHFAPSDPAPFAPDCCPVYLLNVPEGEYYGIPALPGQGVKIGRDDIRPGDPWARCTPDSIKRTVAPEEVSMYRTVLDRYLPGAAGEVLWTLTCMYTNTPDYNFILDCHPEHRQVVYGCGFSGHGFKFAAVIGEVLADLATEGTSRHDVAFLAAGRFAQTAS